jgi:hypothetical protein
VRDATDRSHFLSRDLDLAVAHALSIVDRHERGRARALAELGDIQLPEGPAGGAAAAADLEPLGPFYLAYELELAGLLRTAELLAGLFASGSITAPLGAAAKQLAAFWQDRRNRLAPQERLELFQHVFEPPYFDRLLAAVMQTIASLGDHLQVPDWHEAALLEQGGEQLIEFLGSRAGGMVSFAAHDITNTIDTALSFMRNPELLRAFGVRDLWELVQYAAGENGGTTLAELQRHVDLGKSGQVILSWLAESARAGSLHLDSSTPGVSRLAAAAQTWLAAEGDMGVGSGGSAGVPAALVPMAPVAPAPLVRRL